MEQNKNMIEPGQAPAQRPCPVCLEMIDKDAKVCPYCDEPTHFGHEHQHGASPVVADAAVDEKPAKGMSLWKKALIGVGCVFAALFVIGLLLPDDDEAESEDVELAEAMAALSEESESLDAPKLLTVQNVEYWDNLNAQGGNTYEPANMLDGNPATAWAVNLDNASFDSDKLYGPTFTVSCKKLSHIVLRNGYAKNEASFKNNARASRIIFCNAESVSDEDEAASYLYEGIVKDTPEPQTLEVNSQANSNITSIQLIFPVDGLRRGDKWNDLCVSEVEFWGWE